jgi:SPP1 family predicted phage head-tail adaptor
MSFRPKGFRLGTMRHLVTIQKPTESVDVYGEPVVTWSDYLVDEPASWRTSGGSESINGRQVEADERCVFVVRYRDGYKTTMRVKHNGNYYGILHVGEVDGGRRYLELFTRASGDV